MSERFRNHQESHRPTVYQIRIHGQIGQKWTDWFDGLSISLVEGDTLLTGPLVDQAALHGIMKKLRDLGVTLVSINQIKELGEEESPVLPE
jgi:hypothetical protein